METSGGFLAVYGHLALELNVCPRAEASRVDQESQWCRHEGEDDGFENEHREQTLVDDADLQADVQDDELDETTEFSEVTEVDG